MSEKTIIALRYAMALFDLGKQANKLSKIKRDMADLRSALAVSVDLRYMLHVPIYSRIKQRNAIVTLATKMNLSKLTINTLAIIAEKRRLFILPEFIDELTTMIATEKDEMVAEVISACQLTKLQLLQLAEKLNISFGKKILLKVTVDKSLIGGLMVKVGSKMIDSSIRSQLSGLENAMKEVK